MSFSSVLSDLFWHDVSSPFPDYVPGSFPDKGKLRVVFLLVFGVRVSLTLSVRDRIKVKILFNVSFMSLFPFWVRFRFRIRFSIRDKVKVRGGHV